MGASAAAWAAAADLVVVVAVAGWGAVPAAVKGMVAASADKVREAATAAGVDRAD